MPEKKASEAKPTARPDTYTEQTPLTRSVLDSMTECAKALLESVRCGSEKVSSACQALIIQIDMSTGHPPDPGALGEAQAIVREQFRRWFRGHLELQALLRGECASTLHKAATYHRVLAPERVLGGSYATAHEAVAVIGKKMAMLPAAVRNRDDSTRCSLPKWYVELFGGHLSDLAIQTIPHDKSDPFYILLATMIPSHAKRIQYGELRDALTAEHDAAASWLNRAQEDEEREMSEYREEDDATPESRLEKARVNDVDGRQASCGDDSSHTHDCNTGESIEFGREMPGESGCRHSPDFRSVKWKGQHFTLATTAAMIIQELWEAWENGAPEVSFEHIVEKRHFGGARPRIRDYFRHVSGWKELIEPGKTKGAWRMKQ